MCPVADEWGAHSMADAARPSHRQCNGEKSRWQPCRRARHRLGLAERLATLSLEPALRLDAIPKDLRAWRLVADELEHAEYPVAHVVPADHRARNAGLEEGVGSCSTDLSGGYSALRHERRIDQLRQRWHKAGIA